MIVDRDARVLEVKLVYFGAALSGKTTNLERLNDMMPVDGRAPLTSLKTEGDRTLFFDFLPIEIPLANGWKVRLRTFTVPGQAQYEATRRLVLRGVDGVAFIADSHPGASRENRLAMQNLRANLQTLGLSVRQVPVVLQYNKRDLPMALAIEAMDGDLNHDRFPRFEAVAARGVGVKETFEALALQTVSRVLTELRIPMAAAAQLQQSIGALLVPPVEGRQAADVRTYDLRPQAVDDREAPVEDLLTQAITGSMRMASDLAAATEALKLLEHRRAELAWLGGVAGGSDADIHALLASAMRATGCCAASLLSLPPGQARLDLVASVGLVRDPLDCVDVGGGTLAARLLQGRKAVVTTHATRDLLFGQEHPALHGVRAVVAAPLVAVGRPVGLLSLYGFVGGTWTPTEDELNFARAAASALIPVMLGLRVSA